MATSYPMFTSATTGETTWSDGGTSTVNNPTPTYSNTNNSTNNLASLSSLSGLVAALGNLLRQQTTTSTSGIPAPSVYTPMPYPVSTSASTGQTTYSGGQVVQNPITPKPAATQGIGSQQQVNVRDAQGNVITGAYAKNSQGGYSSVPIQSLSFGATAASPEVSNNVRKTADRLNLSLNTAKNDPFASNGTKSSRVSGIMESTAGEFAKNFQSADEFNFAYNSNPAIKNSLDRFVQMGGSLDQILAKIQATQGYTVGQGETIGVISNKTGKSIDDILALNPQITDPNNILPGTALNLGGGTQTTTSYLAELNKPYVTNPEALLNMSQDELMRNEIIRQFNIPKEYADHYFGTPERMGYFEQEQENAKERIRLNEEQARDDARATREKAQLQIDKYREQARAEDAEIQANQLKAKNYMTGMLAKLGALKTTGVAGEALVKLDAKYEQMRISSRNKYDFAIRDLEIRMNEDINNIENSYASDSAKVRENLTKSASDISKELMKLQQSSDSKIYSIATSYAKLLETQKKKYIETTKKTSGEYITEFKNVVSIGQTPGIAFSPAQKASLSSAYTSKPGTQVAVQTPKVNFTNTEWKKLVQAGLSNASQQQQLDYLFGKKTTTSPDTGSSLSDEEFLAELRK